MGTTAWKYEKGSWSDITSDWKSSDEWGWREELRSNGYDADPAVRLGDLDSDSFAAEAYAKSGEAPGYAVIVTVGEGGEAVVVSGLPDLVGLLAELGPAVKHVSDLSGGATSALEREYARLRRLGYPHEVADAASRAYAEEIEDDDEDDGGAEA
ncbi:MAG: hypothetical protein ABIS47_12405 [Acidimicrobiales bacterium]